MTNKEQKNNVKHPLHKKIGCLLREKFQSGNTDVILDEACDNRKSGKQQIPLFMGDVKNRKSSLCKVDAMIVEGDSCKAVIEIEESGFLPTKIFGKYLTTAFSTCHLRNDKRIKLESKGVFFLQVINARKFTEDKKEQLLAIAGLINKNTCGCVKRYALLLVENDSDCDKITGLIASSFDS
jgi:hypothetical protein